jgi:hypothetical protein
MALDVVGQAGRRPNFIAHTGLARNAAAQDRNGAQVYHMGPPLEAEGRMTVDAVGAAELTDGESRRIMDFIDRHAGEHAAATLAFRNLMQQRNRPELLRLLPQLYCIHPHKGPFREPDGRYARMKFSCAGFVFGAYQEARISLFDEKLLPVIDLVTIKEAYPRYAGFLDDPNFRASMGLSGADKWPVMLCGYLLHAMHQDNAAIRQSKYSPKEGDQYFAE